jgi:nucleotidyltransferase substrate binding protein (TIGR01987 family)
MLDFSSLDKAVAALREAVRIHDENALPEDAPEKLVLRDGVIQRFEFTFELSWKMLKRHLEHYGLERVDALTNRDLFRVGFERGLLAEAGIWLTYLKMRNQTSHVYDNAVAREVFRTARDFLSDAQSLLNRLKEQSR